jgi:hypothetical protein
MTTSFRILVDFAAMTFLRRTPLLLKLMVKNELALYKLSMQDGG